MPKLLLAINLIKYDSTTNLMKACLCLYVDKIWFKVVYMLYFSFQKLELYCINQKTQYLNNISTTFTTIF